MKKREMMNPQVPRRKAIAMIELIFALVVMGITLLSVPNLIFQATQSGYTTIQQEAIAASAADLSLILSREWDEIGTNDSTGSPILDTGSSTTSLQSRPGARSRTFETGVGGGHLSASAIGSDAGDLDDIDDSNGTSGVLTLIDGTKDLIDVNISVATTVKYITDAASSGDWNNSTTIRYNFPPTGTPGGSTNIKEVDITLTSSNTAAELSDKVIKFKAFSANIGSYKLERRVLP